MSALGYYDIINELGQNILIYPLNHFLIKGGSIDLTASKYAWSINDGKSLIKGNKIVIPPGQTVVIFTNETIYVSEKICGTYHPKVSLVSQGLSHIATTLDPLFIGISSITLTNLSDKEIKIPIGSTFVSIILYYINTPSKNTQTHTSKEFITILNQYQNYDSFYTWVGSNNWIFEYKELRDKVVGSEKYREIKKLSKYRNNFKFLLSSPNALPLLTIVVILLLIPILFLLGVFSFFAPSILPLVVYCMIELFKNHNGK